MKQQVDASGKITSYNEGRVSRHRNFRVPCDIAEVPSKPPNDLVPIEQWSAGTQKLIERMQELYDTRPIWTRRTLINNVQDLPRGDIRHAYAYVGYEFQSGPWQSTIVKYGVDPRKDVQYRIYQSMTIHLPKEDSAYRKASRGGIRAKRAPDRASEIRPAATTHLFDGENINVEDGRSWQVCDITDPILKALLATRLLRNKCHVC